MVIQIHNQMLKNYNSNKDNIVKYLGNISGKKEDQIVKDKKFFNGVDLNTL